MNWFVMVLFACLTAGCRQAAENDVADAQVGGGLSKEEVLVKNAEWKGKLTPEQFRVARCGGTERPGTGAFLHHKEKGVYTCVCCGHSLFPADTKYDSGSGWPSFWKPVATDAVAEKRDVSLGMVRTEVLCPKCGAHLGHVFEDGPDPTGLRYCINSASLDFTPVGGKADQ